MPPNPLSQVKEILQFGQLKLASKEELAVIVKAILQAVKDLKDTNAKEMNAIITALERSEKKAERSIEQTVTQAKKDIQEAVAQVEGKIPTMPDLSGLDTRIATLEQEETLQVEDVINELPKLGGTQIRDALELLQGEERLDKSAVKGLDEIEKKLNERIDRIPTGRSAGGFRASHYTAYFPLTPDGTTKIFTVPKSIYAVVHGSDFPHIYFESATGGFTLNSTRTQLTFNTVEAPTANSQLVFAYSKVFN